MGDFDTEQKRLHRESPCLICGGTSFDWGTLLGYKAQIRYKSSTDKRWIITRWSLPPIEARQCETCGNIQLFAPLNRDD
jgi:hypothetical protein